jgi:hypothetical protein
MVRTFAQKKIQIEDPIDEQSVSPATEQKQDEIIAALTTISTLRLKVNGVYTYIGKAEMNSSELSPVWQIKRIDKTSGIVIKWADSGNFSQIWSDYLTLTYN